MRSYAITLFLVPALACAQDCPPLDTVGVVIVEGVTAAELHSRAKAWFANVFQDSREVVQMDDEGSRTLIGKGTKESTIKELYDGGWMHFTVEVSCKDGRYRFNIHSIYHENLTVKTLRMGGASAPIEAIDFGTFYDCATCCELHVRSNKEHPKQTAAIQKRAKYCKTDLMPQVDKLVALLVSSLTEGMAIKSGVSGDW